MMPPIAERLRRRYRLSWPWSSSFSRHERAATAPAMQLRPDARVERGADVLEDIWRKEDRSRRQTKSTLSSGLWDMLRAAMDRLKVDVFGACLCCKAPLGLSRVTAEPWTALCTRCQEAADRDDAEVLRIRSRKERN